LKIKGFSVFRCPSFGVFVQPRDEIDVRRCLFVDPFRFMLKRRKGGKAPARRYFRLGLPTQLVMFPGSDQSSTTNANKPSDFMSLGKNSFDGGADEYEE
jgi:hypothetical protein